FEAALHALWPLQELPPTHFTCGDAGLLESSAITVVPLNIKATAVARTAPASVDFFIRQSPFSSLPMPIIGVYGCGVKQFPSDARTLLHAHALCLNRISRSNVPPATPFFPAKIASSLTNLRHICAKWIKQN